MLSRRELMRRRGKKNIMTTGGMDNYMLHDNDFNEVVKVLANKNVVQTKLLLKSLLTNRELSDIARRILIAKMIVKGEGYENILKKIGCSKNTVSLVNKSLMINNGILKQAITNRGGEEQVERYIKNRLKKGK